MCLGHLGRTKTKKITFGNHTKFVLGLAALSVEGNIKICINPGGGEGRVEEARDVSNFKTPCGPEVSRIIELGNVWFFVQLIFGPHWPMNQLKKPKHCLTPGFLIPLMWTESE